MRHEYHGTSIVYSVCRVSHRHPPHTTGMRKTTSRARLSKPALSFYQMQMDTLPNHARRTSGGSHTGQAQAECMEGSGCMPYMYKWMHMHMQPQAERPLP